MCRSAWAFIVVVPLFGHPGRADGQEKSRLADALAVQETLKEAIKKAEPSIACILVSRSEHYRHFGDVTYPDQPGRLGTFNRDKATRGVSNDDKAKLDLIKRLDLSDPDNVPESFGSGVVIDDSGLILTNRHVVLGATKLYVRLPGGKASYADIHADDPRSDLAVLRITDEKVLPVKALKLGDGGSLQKGDYVLSLANPFAAGFRDGSPSASWGIISNLRRRAPGSPKEEERRKKLHEYGTLLQLDARLNLGCSGGALINLKGEMVGLTTAVAALSGSETPGGFAVPLDAGMRRIMDVLRRGEEVEYGFLGVSFDPTPERGQEGVKIANAIEGSPAWQAGLRGGERILKINGVAVNDYDELFLVIGTSLAGSPARLEIANATRPVTVTLAKFHVPGKVIASKRPEAVGGLRVDYTSILVQPSTERLAERRVARGVVIREVVPGSAADAARLQVDKIISHVNGREVLTPKQFYDEMSNAKGSVKLTLLHGQRTDEVTLEIK